MTAPTFERAVNIAKFFIASHLIPSEDYDCETLTGLAASRASQCDTTTSDGYLKFCAENHGAQMLLSAPEQLVKAAEVDYFSYVALTRAAANVLELAWPMPRCVELWLIRLARDETRPPRRPKAQPNKDVRRLKTYHAVQYLSNLGLKPTRNEASKEQHSACDAVALAHRELNMAPRSYKRVLEIYSEQKRLWGDDVLITLSPELAEVIETTSETTK